MGFINFWKNEVNLPHPDKAIMNRKNDEINYNKKKMSAPRVEPRLSFLLNMPIQENTVLSLK